VRIEVPNAGNLQFFTLWVALGARLFEHEGLSPQIIVDDKPREAGSHLLKGDADVAVLPPPMFLGMMAEDKPIALFASLLANEPINLIVRKDVAQARDLASKHSLKDRLTAIKGLRVGVADGPPPRLRAMLAAAGMDALHDIQIEIVDGPDQVAAMRAGTVDALFAHTPYLETALVDDGAFLLVEASRGEIPALTGGQIHALATTRAKAESDPALIAAVTRAIQRAEQLIHSDPKATVEAVLASRIPGLDATHVTAIAAIYAGAVPVTPAISEEGIVRDAALYPAHPRRPDFTQIRASDFIAPTFAARATKAVAARPAGGIP
jgi:NitT/TauT family transport system substrate-binding protein